MDLQPLCAQPCISSAMLAVGCKVNDQSCGCKPELQQSIGSLAASCLIANCPATALVAIDSAGKAGCAAYSLTYMFSNVPSTMATATISLTSSLPSPTGTISSSSGISLTSSLPSPTGIISSSSGSAIPMTVSSSSSPTNFPAPTSSTNPALHPASKLSTPTLVGLGIGGFAFLFIVAFAMFCCLRHRRVNLRASLRRSDSEIFSLVHTPELETKSLQHELLSPSSEISWRIQNQASRASRASRTSIYELSSEESLLREPAPPARVARKSEDEMEKLDEVFMRDAMVLAKTGGLAEEVKMEKRMPQIVVHLADRSRANVQKPRRLRKMEKVTSLRELKLGKETLEWD